MLEVELSKPDKRRFLDYLAAKPAQVERAGNRAMKKTLRWGAGHTARELARASRVPVKTIRGKSSNPANQGKANADRVRVRLPLRGQDAGYLWVGSRPIKAGYVGKLRQLKKKGARAGRHLFKDAFVAQMKSGHQGIFKRAGDERLPIGEQAVKLQSADEVVGRIRALLPQRLRVVMDQELNYELRVRGR